MKKVLSRRFPLAARIGSMLKETFHEWSDDGASRLAAALAYYTIFSLAPLLIIVIAVAGFFFGETEARDTIFREMHSMLGPKGADYIKTLLDTSWEPSTGLIATLVGFGVLLVGATGAFAQLQEALNIIWEAPPRKGKGVWSYLRQRLLSFSLVLTIGFLLLVSLVLSAAISAISRSQIGVYLSGIVPFYEPILHLVNLALSFGVTTVLFAAIYKILPDVKVRWKNVWWGAAAASLLFSIGRFLLGLYLGRSSFDSVYGAAGSFVVILFWIYYSVQILFFGAEFTQVSARRDGHEGFGQTARDRKLQSEKKQTG